MDQCDDQDQNESTFIRRIDPTVSEKLKRPESLQLKERILKYFKKKKNTRFIRDVQSDKYPQDKLPQLIMARMEEFEDEFQEIWKENEELAIENGEAFEKIIMKPLCTKLINIDPTRDKSIEFALKMFDFVELKHLEIDQSVQAHSQFDNVIKEIKKIEEVQTPKDKLTCMITACKLVSNIVSQLANNAPTGADNFLPVLIFATLRSQPKKPYSNLRFISQYRSPKRINGNEEYYFTAYESALEFIESLDHTKLKITAQEFNDFRSQRMEGLKQQQVEGDGTFQIDANRNYLNLQMIKMKIQDLSKKSRFYEQSKKQKLKYANKQLSEIKLTEVQDFHNEYNILYKNLLDMQKEIENLQSITENVIKESLNKSQSSQTKKFFGIL